MQNKRKKRRLMSVEQEEEKKAYVCKTRGRKEG